MSVATEDISEGPLESSSGTPMSILSSKVQRAMQIRTDTPAMKAALDALGQLSSSVVESDASSLSLDARSVRHAIEYDALQQALSLRRELTSLCLKLRHLRQGISETAQIAHKVKQAIHTNVVVQSGTTQFNVKTAGKLMEMNSLEDSNIITSSSQQQQPQQDDEERLAATLAEAFAKRNLAQERLTAVHRFLEMFDMSEQDSRLLDYYNFEDLDLTYQRNIIGGTEAGPLSGMEFLKALERVRQIRHELTKTFGAGSPTSLLEGEGRASSLGASSALRMMEHLAQKQEQAYERLYHWLQSHLQLFANSQSPQRKKKISFELDTSSNPENEEHDSMDQALQHPFVQASLHTLRHVPAFYRHMLELIAGRRRQEETRIFLLALTSGYSGLPPLERLAHDPVAYVGDMLAFAFKSMSMEADVALTIVHYQSEQANQEGQPHQKQSEQKESGESGDGPEHVDDTAQKDNELESTFDYSEKPLTGSDLLSTSLSGMARPLKSRVVQVITALASRSDGESDVESDDGLLDDFEEEGRTARSKLIHLYEICGLLLFYLSAMTKTVRKVQRLDEKCGLVSKLDVDEEGGIGNSLLLNMKSCLTEGVKAFEATVRVYSATMASLSASTGESVASLAKALMLRIAEVRKSSPGFAKDVEGPGKEFETTLSITWIATQVVEAALPYCSILDDTVTMKNAISAAKQAGMDSATVQQLDQLVDGTETILVDELVEAETAKVLQLCGIGNLVSDWKQWKLARDSTKSSALSGDFDETLTPPSLTMVSHPGLSAEELGAAMNQFYASLHAPPLPSLELAVKEDRALRQRIRSKIAGRVSGIYQELYDDLTDPNRGGYNELVVSSVLGHDPSQVESLLLA